MKNARLLAVLIALVAIFANLTSGASAAAFALQKDWVYRDGLLLATIETSGTKYFHLDHLGTPRRITNSSRAVIASHDYYPFGEEITASSQDAEALKFTGHERDLRDPTKTTDDLDYMHARHYNPWIGRFLSVDPVGGNPETPQSWNRYSYVQNNPVNATDPDGKWFETAFDIGMAAISIRQAWREPSFANIAGAALDVGAVALPVVPAVAGRAIDAAQAADKLVDTARAADAAGDAARGGAAAVRAGQAGEAAVRAAVDIGPTTRITVNGATRIPDGLTDVALSEVKNVSSLSYTQQLRDYAQFASENGLRFDLYVKPGAQLSGPLLDAQAAGAVNILEIPF